MARVTVSVRVSQPYPAEDAVYERTTTIEPEWATDPRAVETALWELLDGLKVELDIAARHKVERLEINREVGA